MSGRPVARTPSLGYTGAMRREVRSQRRRESSLASVRERHTSTAPLTCPVSSYRSAGPSGDVRGGRGSNPQGWEAILMSFCDRRFVFARDPLESSSMVGKGRSICGTSLERETRVPSLDQGCATPASARGDAPTYARTSQLLIERSFAQVSDGRILRLGGGIYDGREGWNCAR
jgi:hypothetical protein